MPIERPDNEDEIRIPIKMPPVESGSEEDSKKRELIAGCTSFEHLYEAIQKIGNIQGSNALYSPERLIESIKAVREKKTFSEAITRTYGLRAKVKELLLKEN